MQPDAERHATAERAVVGAAVALGRGLRELGVPTSVDGELVLCRALAEVDLASRARVYWSARCTLVRHPDDLPAFDAVFARFWSGQAPTLGQEVAEHGESDPRVPGPQHGGESLPQYRTEGRSSQLLDGEPTRATQEIPSAGNDEERDGDKARARGVLAAYSPEEVLAEQDRLRYAEQELLAVRRLAEELRRAVPERRSRRQAPSSRSGRLDVRATVRRSLRTHGEALRPVYCDASRRPRRILVICDVSGSMDRYSRALLGALEAAVSSGVKVEAFVFATQLTRVTGPLSGRDVGAALEQARAAVPDWSGGTRIGPALAEFNVTFARRGFARGALVIIVSDGWDRGDPRTLRDALARLRLQARRLVWVNPRPTELAGQPLALGMRTALPYVDDYVAGGDRDAAFALGRVLAGLAPGRPARRQRAV